MKTMMFLLLLSFSAYSFDIPKELLNLIPEGQNETLLKGMDGAHECHVRIWNKDWGYNIDVFYPNSEGGMNIYEVAHFAIDYSYELYDYWVYAYGVEAIARHFSPMGPRYDTRATLFLDYRGDVLHEIDLKQEKKNILGIFYTDQHISCQLTKP